MILSRRSFLALAAAAPAGCTTLVDKVVYSPQVGAVTPASYVASKPEILKVRVPDGTSVEAWYFPPRSPLQPVIAVLHGTGGNIGVIARQSYPFLAMGYGLLVFDYRGYSANPGRPSESGMIEDAAAQLAALRDRDIEPSRTILFGHSLGGAVTLITASLLEQRGISYRGIVTWGSVASMSYMAPIIGELLPEQFDAITAVARISAPKVFLHGGRDNVVPPDSVYKLANRARPPSAAIRVQDGYHDFEAEKHSVLFEQVFAAVQARNLNALTGLAARDVKVAVKSA